MEEDILSFYQLSCFVGHPVAATKNQDSTRFKWFGSSLQSLQSLQSLTLIVINPVEKEDEWKYLMDKDCTIWVCSQKLIVSKNEFFSH